jgi:hypothetical protein
MYHLARLLLISAFLAALYDLAIIALLCWPASMWLALAVAFFGVKKAAARLTSHGSARWAGERDISHMLEAPEGLIVGHLAIDGDKKR